MKSIPVFSVLSIVLGTILLGLLYSVTITGPGAAALETLLRLIGGLAVGLPIGYGIVVLARGFSHNGC